VKLKCGVETRRSNRYVSSKRRVQKAENSGLCILLFLHLDRMEGLEEREGNASTRDRFLFRQEREENHRSREDFESFKNLRPLCLRHANLQTTKETNKQKDFAKNS